MSSNMDTEPKTDVPERVINGQNPATSGNSLLGNRRENNVSVPYHKLGNIDLDQIIGRIAEGTYAADIAKELGCSKAALHYKLRQHPAYQEAKLIGVELRLDEGLIEMESAGDDLNLVRAREARLRRLEWRAEREHPERWGQRPTSQVNVSGQGVTVQLVQFGVADTPHDAAHTVDNDGLADDQDSK